MVDKKVRIYDLSPPHRNRTSGVHGSGTDTLLTSAYKDEQDELNFITSQVIKSILFSLWQSVDWSEVDLWDIDWSEWIEPVLRSGEATEPFDWNKQNLNNIKALNLTGPTELTISGNAITKTQGSHTIDTEGDVAEDYLDTINGGVTGDLLILQANNTARTTIVRHGVGNIQIREAEAFPTVHFNSPSGLSGIFYAAGFLDAPATDANLNQGSTTVNHGTANSSEAAHIFVVAAGDGAKTGGDLVLTVTGVSMDDKGNRNGSDSEVIVADAIAASFATNARAETTRKWLGQPTITLSSSGGGNFNCSFNYGFAKYNDFGNRKFHITDFECVGRAGANDTGFNIRLFYISNVGWTYHATAFVPGGTVLANMNTDHSPDDELVSGKYFSYKRDNLDSHINGADAEGVIVEITTTANKAVETMDIIFGGHVRPDHIRLDDTEQAIHLWYDGSNWHEL